MADAKIISYGKDIGAGATVIPDNQVALDIESTDAKEYVQIDTTDSAEKLLLAGGGAKVGVNKAAPLAQLHVRTADSGQSSAHAYADEFIIEGSASSGMTIMSGNVNTGAIAFADSGSTYQGALQYIHSANRLALNNTGSERLVVASTGNVGINDQTPSAKLTVEASGSNEDLVQFNGSAGTVAAQVETFDGISGAMTFYSASGHNMHRINAREGSNGFVNFNEKLYDCNFNIGSENLANAFHVDASADKVGINTAAPGALLSMAGSLTTALSSGTVSTSGSSTTLTGSSTAFLTDFAIGSAIKVGSVTTTVTAIASDTSLTLEDAINTGTTGTTCTRDPDLLEIKSGDGKVHMKLDNIGQLTLGDTATAGNILITDGDVVTSTAVDNVIIGTETRTTVNTSESILIGKRAGRGTDVTKVTAIGAWAGEEGVGTESVWLGYQAGIAGGGNYSTGLGSQALRVSTMAGGGSNGQHNVGIGYNSGSSLVAAYDSVIIGSGANGAAALQNQIAIGRSATCDAAHTAVIGNSSIVLIRPDSDRGCDLGSVAKEFDDVHCVAATEVSDGRLKEQVVDTALGLNFVNRLRPVSYKFRDTEAVYETVQNGELTEERLMQPALTHSRKHEGLIAQEVKQVLDDIGIDSNDFGGYVDASVAGGPDRLALRYREFIPALIKSIQELSARVEELENGE